METQENKVLSLVRLEDQALTVKQVLKKSQINVNSAKFVLSNYGEDLIEIELKEGGEYCDLFSYISNKFYWKLKGKVVRLEKGHPVILRMDLSNGEETRTFQVQKDSKRDQTGKAIPFNAKSIGSLLKDLFMRFGAEIMSARIDAGYRDNFNHATNSLASFVHIDPPKAIPSATKHKAEK